MCARQCHLITRGGPFTTMHGTDPQQKGACTTCTSLMILCELVQYCLTHNYMTLFSMWTCNLTHQQIIMPTVLLNRVVQEWNGRLYECAQASTPYAYSQRKKKLQIVRLKSLTFIIPWWKSCMRLFKSSLIYGMSETDTLHNSLWDTFLITNWQHSINYCSLICSLKYQRFSSSSTHIRPSPATIWRHSQHCLSVGGFLCPVVVFDYQCVNWKRERSIQNLLKLLETRVVSNTVKDSTIIIGCYCRPKLVCLLVKMG